MRRRLGSCSPQHSMSIRPSERLAEQGEDDARGLAQVYMHMKLPHRQSNILLPELQGEVVIPAVVTDNHAVSPFGGGPR